MQVGSPVYIPLFKYTGEHKGFGHIEAMLGGIGMWSVRFEDGTKAHIHESDILARPFGAELERRRNDGTLAA